MELAVDDQLKRRLLATNEEFRQLADLHQKYDDEIQSIETRGLVTPPDEDLEQRLKKLKLSCKDRMNEILRHELAVAQ